MRLLVALVVWLGAIAGGVAVSSVVASGIHNTAGGSSGSSASGSSASDPSDMTATDPASLFHTANFQKALATAESHIGAGAKLDNFVVYPGYLSLTAVQGGSENDVTVYTDGRSFVTDAGSNPGVDTLFSLSKIRPSVPAALSLRIARTGKLTPSQLHYMVADVDSETKKLEWLVYPVSGTRVEYFHTFGTTGPMLEYRTGSTSGPVRVKG